jgi:hypothetical protein
LPIVLVPSDRWCARARARLAPRARALTPRRAAPPRSLCSCIMTVPSGIYCIQHNFGKDASEGLANVSAARHGA